MRFEHLVIGETRSFAGTVLNSDRNTIRMSSRSRDRSIGKTTLNHSELYYFEDRIFHLGKGDYRRHQATMISQFYSLISNRKGIEREARVVEMKQEIQKDYTKENTFKPVINNRVVKSRGNMSHDRYSKVLATRNK